MSGPARAGIALGSNLGDRLGFLREGLLSLRKLDESGSVLVSGLYESDPVGCADGDPAFLNAVVEITTSLAPRELLARTQETERSCGRLPVDERSTNAPRPLDLDLLYLDEVKLDSPELILPHPRMLERSFVLLPLAEIRPDLVPTIETISHTGIVRIAGPEWAEPDSSLSLQ